LSSSGFLRHENCPACGSSDALGVFDDGHTHCFSCNAHTNGDGSPGSPSDDSAPVVALLPGEPIAIPARRLMQATCAKYRYTVNEEKNAQLATYFDHQGRPIAQKVRTPGKNFRWTGEPKKALLFGQQLWGQGGDRVVITEGEIDALSVAQVFNLKWPVVSIPNGAQAARKDLEKHLEWLESFKKVVFMFDNDEHGQKAAAACAELLSPGKAHIAQLPLKDPNEMLQAERGEEIARCVYEAKVLRPDGIVNGSALWDVVTRKLEHGVSYPWASLDQKVYGMRTAEIVCWCAGTGIGKSQFVREVAYHLVTQHQQRVGIIALEESVRDTGLGQMSLAANARLHLPGVQVAAPDFRAAFDATLGTGRYVLYDHFGSVEAATLLPKIRYMVLAEKCKWIVLDHISIVVSGFAAEGDERKRIDELMTKLRQLAQELDFGLHIVSHLRRGGADSKAHEEGGRVTLADLRGSGAIAQVSNIIVAVERNPQSVGDAKNRSKLRVLKNRFSGDQGDAGTLIFGNKTGRLTEFFSEDDDTMSSPEPLTEDTKKEDF